MWGMQFEEVASNNVQISLRIHENIGQALLMSTQNICFCEEVWKMLIFISSSLELYRPW